MAAWPWYPGPRPFHPPWEPARPFYPGWHPHPGFGPGPFGPRWYATNETQGNASELDTEMKAYWDAMLGAGNTSEMAAWPWYPGPRPFHPPWQPARPFYPGWHPHPGFGPGPFGPRWYAMNETLGNASELDTEMKAYWEAMLGAGNTSEMAAWP